ncbi:Gfo/Idh/MocA family oxidoreductase [Streptomyces gibsoniae]|uniref:Gfo/Idh/MocA family oxidoreductase n=1 Tax=Streptomyces gibsoniae TaxID=3075529 RepID=A0ABU2TLR2_9ACTN|nr:Gfo/Idh/MocA family oxidoreductase [Streptomyces sp. DSM 41699]MDT0461872.1 Gfo/Idh/MocA family oxidoreductase [Streptomyces sp. DSM 41699]
MFRTLVVGLGRAGAGLHLPILDRLRQRTPGAALNTDAPVVAVDPAALSAVLPPGTILLPTLERARAELDPARTVVHVCTPPEGRVAVIEQLARLGFSNLLVEKPLAVDTAQLGRIEELRRRHRLRLIVVAQWLVSSLTRRLHRIVAQGEFGELREIRVAQRKPRFSRSIATTGHPTAFDIEIPHALGVALRLAGPARLAGATWSDLAADGVVRPRLGTATLSLAHERGPSTHIVSDLTAPVRERRITCEFTGATVIGHYPVSQEDGYAQLAVAAQDRATREVFPDDALTGFLLDAYRRFADGGPFGGDLAVSAEAVRLIDEAKRYCTLRDQQAHSSAGSVRDAG